MQILAKRAYSPELDPFCKICGCYKGIGTCEREGCVGSTDTTRNPVSQQDSTLARCWICARQPTTFCVRCSKGYCAEHSFAMEENKLGTFTQYLGTCSICGNIVCENCWILDEASLIRCINHDVDTLTN